MTLTGRAGLMALAGGLVIAVFGSGIAVLVVNAVIVAMIALDLILAARIGSLRVSRSGDPKIHLSQSGPTRLTVVNAGRRRLRGVVRDAWQPSALAQPRRTRITVDAGSRATMTTTLTPQRRGDFEAGRVTIRSLGPLGLAGRQRNRSAPLTVRVLPPFLSRKHLPEKLAKLRELDGQHKSILRGQGSEFDSLRAYVLGDDVRSIDWRSSARRADVLVRTWRPERDRRIVIVLDTGRTSAGRVGGIPRLDSAMDAALLLAALAVTAGDRVDLIAVDRRVRARVIGAARGDVLAAFTNELAILEPELTEPDIGLMVATVLGIARQRCLVVLLTDLNPAAIELGLMPHISMLSARHQVVLAAVADPRLAEMAAGRGDTTAVYEAAAAVTAQAGRARTAALLRRSGVEVVDAPPDRLPPALADAYLSLKAAGRL
ncbi:MAG TPA: DUF58 domain-containing protein [Streptosporangiaceae bacterium]|jgi:uncharacterized protein (DUF58 family)|nr:DUF58 domain-containing protein [Streptosporangiaceae bacterium]